MNDTDVSSFPINEVNQMGLKERLESFYEKPIDEIFVETINEILISTGKPVGNEIW